MPTALVVATVIFIFAASALASQGPGTSPGAATFLEQILLIGALAAAMGIGLILRLRHRAPAARAARPPVERTQKRGRPF
jgi:hypothetical protein